MKRPYDIQRLAEKHGFQEDEIEKVCRISDILEDISAIPFLIKRLSLYGGTALNLIHFPGIPRLSVDIDFNYRHVDEGKDWGDVRDKIDAAFKQVLRSVGKESVVVVATRDKVDKLSCLRVDTGEAEVDEMLRGYIKVMIDYREWRLIKVD